MYMWICKWGVPLVALATRCPANLSRGMPRTWSTTRTFSTYSMTSVSVIWKTKFICSNRHIRLVFFPGASATVTSPWRRKHRPCRSPVNCGVLIHLAEMQSAPALKFVTIPSVAKTLTQSQLTEILLWQLNLQEFRYLWREFVSLHFSPVWNCRNRLGPRNLEPLPFLNPSNVWI